MLKFRNFEEGDYETYIQELTKNNMKQLFLDNFGGWSDEVSAKKFFEVEKTGHAWLFFLKEKFIGYVTFGVEKNNADSYLIHDIHIVKEYQGKGYGKEILSYLVDFALHKKQLKVFVFENNPAHLFYRKQGFKEIEYVEKSKTFVLVRKI